MQSQLCQCVPEPTQPVRVEANMSANKHKIHCLILFEGRLWGTLWYRGLGNRQRKCLCRPRINLLNQDFHYIARLPLFQVIVRDIVMC